MARNENYASNLRVSVQAFCLQFKKADLFQATHKKLRVQYDIYSIPHYFQFDGVQLLFKLPIVTDVYENRVDLRCIFSFERQMITKSNVYTPDPMCYFLIMTK